MKSCKICKDTKNMQCKRCICNLCFKRRGKTEIIQCKDCYQGYHTKCVSHVLSTPYSEWRCIMCCIGLAPRNKMMALPKVIPSTKRTYHLRQRKGEARICETKKLHFGNIENVKVGMWWKTRKEVSQSGVHRPLTKGVDFKENDGVYSILLHGDYDVEEDQGDVLTLVSGGAGVNRRRKCKISTKPALKGIAMALSENCAAIRKEEGSDAGSLWRLGKPVRIVRSSQMARLFPIYSPKFGYRYDGTYKVVNYYANEKENGMRMWKMVLRRHDETPAPWTDAV